MTKVVKELNVIKMQNDKRKNVLKNFCWENKPNGKIKTIYTVLVVCLSMCFVKIMFSHKLSFMEQAEDICYSMPPSIPVDDTFYISFVLIGIFTVLGVCTGIFRQVS